MENKPNGFWSNAGSIAWQTPESILEPTRELFYGQIDLDPCAPADPTQQIATTNYSLPQNGLALPWTGKVFINPPFGTSYRNGPYCISADQFRKVKDAPLDQRPSSGAWHKQTAAEWASKALRHYAAGGEVVWLSKAAVEQKLFQELLLPVGTSCFLSGRLGYVDPTTRKQMSGPTFNSVVVYLGPNKDRFYETFNHLGSIQTRYVYFST